MRTANVLVDKLAQETIATTATCTTALPTAPKPTVTSPTKACAPQAVATASATLVFQARTDVLVEPSNSARTAPVGPTFVLVAMAAIWLVPAQCAVVTTAASTTSTTKNVVPPQPSTPATATATTLGRRAAVPTVVWSNTPVSPTQQASATPVPPTPTSAPATMYRFAPWAPADTTGPNMSLAPTAARVADTANALATEPQGRCTAKATTVTSAPTPEAQQAAARV